MTEKPTYEELENKIKELELNAIATAHYADEKLQEASEINKKIISESPIGIKNMMNPVSALQQMMPWEKSLVF